MTAIAATGFDFTSASVGKLANLDQQLAWLLDEASQGRENFQAIKNVREMILCAEADLILERRVT